MFHEHGHCVLMLRLLCFQGNNKIVTYMVIFEKNYQKPSLSILVEIFTLLTYQVIKMRFIVLASLHFLCLQTVYLCTFTFLTATAAIQIMQQVPSLEHNNEVRGESLDLMKYIDSHFEGPSLFPSVMFVK